MQLCLQSHCKVHNRATSHDSAPRASSVFSQQVRKHRNCAPCNATRQSGGGSGLIFPGGGQKIKTAADIAQERSAKLKGPRQLESGGTTVTGTLTQFRPPPGFLDATLRGEKVPDQLDTSDTGAMLSQLKAEAGAWPDLAKIISALNRTGLDGVAIEEAAGIGRVQQNRWATAASVYESLRQAGDVPEETLEYFTQDGGDALVYELRFLAVENRSDPACYIANNQLDEHMALVLARSIKEHARRGGDMLGFSIHSGDCLAFKYYRDALECKKERDIEDCIQKGLDCAHSTSAKLKLVRHGTFLWTATREG